MIGQKFGKLTVEKEVESEKVGRWWLCRCECGNTNIVKTSKLRDGRVSSCGCQIGRKQKHGLTGTPEYTVWVNMKRRCYNKNNPSYPDYGGRGIYICERWLYSFENFLSDIGPRPGPEYSIGRVDNNDIYRPENCRWENIQEQSRNKSWTWYVTYKGEQRKVVDLSEENGLETHVVRGRLERGWDIEAALSTPKGANDPRKYIEIDGQTKSIGQHLADYDLSYGTYYYRLNKGWTLEEAIKTPKYRKRRK